MPTISMFYGILIDVCSRYRETSFATYSCALQRVQSFDQYSERRSAGGESSFTADEASVASRMICRTRGAIHPHPPPNLPLEGGGTWLPPLQGEG